jgi:Trypsin-like serine proteases, typically periplasmic, contain C-terminal PDZ domain
MQARHRYIALLAAIAVLILVIGFMLKPAAPPPSRKRAAEPTITHAELENLQQLVRRNSLRSVAANFSTLADQLFPEVATVQPWGAGAVVMPDRGIIAAKSMDAVPEQLTLTSGDSAPSPFSAKAWIPGLPFLAGSITAIGDFSPSNIARSLPAQGSWLLLITDGHSRPSLLSPGIFSGRSEVACGPFIHQQLQTTIPLTSATLGAGVFDLSGGLQGIVVQCDDSYSLIGIADVQQALSQAGAASSILLATYGMRLTAGAAAPNATSGSPVIGEVWTAWPADNAGLQPGDALLSVDDQPIGKVEDAIAALTSDKMTTHRLRLRRGRRTLSTNLQTAQSSTAGTTTGVGMGIGVDTQATGIRLLQVAPGSSAAEAGVRPGDVVLQVNDFPATESGVQSSIAHYRVSSPTSIVVWRPGRRILLRLVP